MATAVHPRATSAGLVAGVLVVVGLAQLLPGLLALLAPGTFYDRIGPYPPENGHFIKDLGSWQVPFGVAALLAARRPAWQVPVLGLLALQYGLHMISHAIDVGESDPSWQGPVALGLQVLGFVVLTGLFLRERGRR